MGTVAYRTGSDGTLDRQDETATGAFLDEALLPVVFPGVMERVESHLQPAPGHERIVDIDYCNNGTAIYHLEPVEDIVVREWGTDGQLQGATLLLGRFARGAFAQRADRIPLLKEKHDWLLRESQASPNSHAWREIRAAFNQFPKTELFYADVRDLKEIIDRIVYMTGDDEIAVHVRRGQGYEALYIAFSRLRYAYQTEEALRRALADAFGPVSFATSVDCGAVTLFLFYFDAAGLEHSVEAEEVRRLTAPLVIHWEDQVAAALERKFGEREGRRLFRRYVTPESRSGLYREVTPAEQVPEDVEHFENLEGRLEIRVIPRTAETVALNLYAVRALGLTDILRTLQNLGLTVTEELRIPISLPEGRKCFLYRFELEAPQWRIAALHLGQGRFIEALRALDEERSTDDPLNSLILLAGLGWRDVEVLRTLRNHLLQVRTHYNAETVNGVLTRNGPAATALYKAFAARFDPSTPGEREVAISEADKGVTDGPGGGAEPGRGRGPARARQPGEVRAPDQRLPEAGAAGLLHQGGQPPRGRDALPAAVRRGLRALAPPGGHPPPRGQDRARGDPLERPPRRLPHRDPGPHEDPDGQERDHRARGQQGRVRPEGRRSVAPGPRRLPRRPLPRVRLRAPRPHRQPRGRPGAPPARGGAPGRRRSLSGGRGGQGDRPPVRHREQRLRAIRVLAGGRLRLRGQRRVRPQEDGHHRPGRLGVREAPLPQPRGRTSRKSLSPWRGSATCRATSSGTAPCRAGPPSSSPPSTTSTSSSTPIPTPSGATRSASGSSISPVRAGATTTPPSSARAAAIFDRSAKAIALTAEMKKLLDLEGKAASGEEVIRKILTARVDLLYNGGIGTYVKAAGETDVQVGDRANDRVRVDGKAVRARVVGEGGNLGFTQRGRLECWARGGSLNTDAVDNSGGVDTSDHEVNIKILLDRLVKKGVVKGRKERNQILAEMTDEVAALVLADNFNQALCLTLDGIRSARRYEEFVALVDDMAGAGILNREDEAVPSRDELLASPERKRGLPRPLLAVLLGYTKMYAFQMVLETGFPDSPSGRPFLDGYFPRRLRESFAEHFESHVLRREIIATGAVNYLVNKAGVTFLHAPHAGGEGGHRRGAGRLRRRRPRGPGPGPARGRALRGLQGGRRAGAPARHRGGPGSVGARPAGRQEGDRGGEGGQGAPEPAEAVGGRGRLSIRCRESSGPRPGSLQGQTSMQIAQPKVLTK